MKIVNNLTPSEAATSLQEEKAILVDVREQNEFDQIRIPGTLHVPLSQFRPDAIPDGGDKRIVFICAHGVRSGTAGQFMLDEGHLEQAYSVIDGFMGWSAAGLPFDVSTA
ncbi:MAG: rhodanese-like domain-containing protein [Rhodospirillales bacterium]|nr:rhodanese-like domain-containing protein [Rhodospirillales bacterium]